MQLLLVRDQLGTGETHPGGVTSSASTGLLLQFCWPYSIHNSESICFLKNGDLLHHVIDTLLLEDIHGLHHSIFVCATGDLGLAIRGWCGARVGGTKTLKLLHFSEFFLAVIAS